MGFRISGAVCRKFQLIWTPHRPMIWPDKHHQVSSGCEGDVSSGYRGEVAPNDRGPSVRTLTSFQTSLICSAMMNWPNQNNQKNVYVLKKRIPKDRPGIWGLDGAVKAWCRVSPMLSSINPVSGLSLQLFESMPTKFKHLEFGW